MVPTHPTSWQRRMLWASLTAIAVAGLIAVVVTGVWVTASVISFLQPLIIPFAVSGVLAYLLEPIATFLCTRWRFSRTGAVVTIFAAALISLVVLGLTVIPSLYRQTVDVARKVPGYVEKIQKKVPEWIDASQEKLRKIGEMMPGVSGQPAPQLPPQAAKRGGDVPEPTPAPTSPAKKNPLDADALREWFDKQLDKLDGQVPAILAGIGSVLGRSIGGFLGVVGFILSAIIVPFCLWYFLKEAPQIKRNWGDYLPLAPSPFKDETVSVLTEINGYLVAFFRGQLLVSLIDGTLIGLALLFLGLDFALLIGLLVVFLSLIPYVGIVLCYIPAVLIATLQFGDFQHPFLVTVIFVAVQQLEGFVISPRIVGETVGLHPLIVILGALGWSLLFGGLLGALLSVPLSAALKVLLQRYVWSHRDRSRIALPAGMIDPTDGTASSEPVLIGHHRE